LQRSADGSPKPKTSDTRKAEVGMKQEVFAMNEGDVVITWPESISAESFEDFSDWMKILLRKVQRNVKKDGDLPSGSHLV
jgi:hypothetical protein